MNGDDCGVSAELTEQVLRAEWQLRGQLRDSLRAGVTLGHLLQQAKGECRHGEWERWLKANYEGTSRHARRLVELSREYSDPNDVPAMSLREALCQLTKSQKADQDFAHDTPVTRHNPRVARLDGNDRTGHRPEDHRGSAAGKLDAKTRRDEEGEGDHQRHSPLRRTPAGGLQRHQAVSRRARQR